MRKSNCKRGGIRGERPSPRTPHQPQAQTRHNHPHHCPFSRHPRPSPSFIDLQLTHYLLHQRPPSPTPSRLYSDDDPLCQPVLIGGHPRHTLGCPRLRWEAQPALQLRDELLVRRGPAQGRRVQPAARGGLTGHGVRMA